MTDIFQRLVARARGEERQLRPQVQGLFEPQGRDDDGFVETTEEKVSPALRRQAAADGAAPAVRQSDYPDPQGRGAPGHPLGNPDIQETATAPEKPAPSPAAEEPSPPDSDRSSTAALDPTRAAAPQRREKAPPPPSAVRSQVQSMPLAARQRADGTDTTAAATTAERARQRSQPGDGETSMTAAATPVEAVSTEAPPKAPGQPFAAFRQPIETPAPGAWQPPAGRRVHIHIDHIEVRQQTRPAAEPPQPRRNANPAPDLNDYLRRRRS